MPAGRSRSASRGRVVGQVIEHNNVLHGSQETVHQRRRNSAVEIVFQNDQSFGITGLGHAESLAERAGFHKRQTKTVALGRDKAQRGGMACIA